MTLGLTEGRNTSKNTGSEDLMRNGGEDIELSLKTGFRP